MKSSRRIDADSVRRDSRDREVAHTSGGSRFSRKRPSMLSEFHGKHYGHNAREGERDSYRSHNRYSHDALGGVASLDHTHASSVPSGVHSKSKNRHSRHHNQNNQNRPSSSSWSHNHSNSRHHVNSSDATPPEEEVPVKRPRLMVDMPRRASCHSDASGDSVVNSVLSNSGLNMGSPTDLSPWPSGAGGLLPYHLEDIDSDDDSLLQEDYNKKLSKSPTPVPGDSPPPPSPPPSSTAGGLKEAGLGLLGGAPMPSKEELLMMMEKVDRDIAAAETQISALEKKRVELEESARTAASTPHSSTLPALPCPDTPPLNQAFAVMASITEEDTPLPSPSPSTRISPKKSQMDIIYSDNRIKSKSAHVSLSSISLSLLPGAVALYHQPCEAPLYHHNLLSHQRFRPKLVQHIRKRKLDKHKKELQLCEEYDLQMAKWEKSVERIETNPKRKLRDQKNRELFERHFPELKVKRDHQERMTRVDQRGYPIVRSDAELNDIIYDLCEAEEGPVRYRKTHAVIPPMLTEECDKRVRFFNENGLLSDPMALHRDSRFVNVWSEEEKSTFRDKYTFYPKNFEIIASFLPNKTPSDCVQYYYLSKKRENFKHIIRKANLKRKKPFVKLSDFGHPQLSPSAIPPLPLSLFASTKKTEDALSADEASSTPLTSEYGDWSAEEISCLKEGLRKYGRAWGKIYREVGGIKTATQCKQFFDKHCADKELELSLALTEHSSMKNAEKMRRKAESQGRKSLSAVMVEGKRKAAKAAAKPPLQESEEMDSENTASASETESNESTSESTITDSSPEDSSSGSAFVQPLQPGKLPRGKKPKLLSSAGFRRTSEEALDLFISAAEALNRIIPPEVALHDHTYAQPPTSILSNMELQGTSGLSLIAAAAAVVSPTLSKSAAGAKMPSLSPVRAPRGRPPNSQRKGNNGTACKLAPTMLSPAGTSPSVLLTEMKAAPLRGRARSAPSDRPKVSTLHVPRTGSTLARMSINSSHRGVGRGGPGGPSPSYARHKDVSTSKSSSALKSMIAFHPSSPSPSSSSSGAGTTSTTATSTNPTSAFEALVNVAVAAPPAELPHSGSSSHANSHPKSSSPAPAFTATPLSRSQPSKDTVTIGVAGSNSNASNSTTTAYIDVNQAINILASLAQQQVSSSAANGTSQSIVLPNSRLFTSNSVSLLGNIVSQSGKSGGTAGLVGGALPTSKGAKGLSVSATVDTLLGHLTSGMGVQAASSAKKAMAGGSGKVKSGKAGSKVVGNAVNVKGPGVKLAGNSAPLPQSIQLMGNMDDLSNLNLLSSLVAAVAASQSTATPTTSHQTTPLSEAPLKATVGQPSNLHGGSKTDVKRPPLESTVSALATVSRNSSSSSFSENSSSSQGHAPAALEVDGKFQEHGEKLIAASSSIRKASMQSLSAGTVYGDATSSTANELPRSVVRTGLGTMGSGEALTSQDNRVAPSESDMTASLASIIPPYNPSMSSQSSLLLYTRSLSFPLSAPPEPPAEEEDHLESATRGISELSKLLGTDSTTESNSSPKHDRTVYKGLSNWNPSDLLTNSALSKNPCGDFAGGLTESSGKPYLSGLLESQEPSGKPYLSGLLESQESSGKPYLSGLLESQESSGKPYLSGLLESQESSGKPYLSGLLESQESSGKPYLSGLLESQDQESSGKPYLSGLLESQESSGLLESQESSGLLESQEPSGKPYLSGMLESQIHGTVHHTSLATPKLNSSTTSAGRNESMETSLDVDHSR